ncbi:MAG TPA: LLM class flavin-dependent oxidoreductase, partial [Gemmatimonadales bacterium]|nr:LLM class flavin-dependent oxidoreductase [Gemmatimonadales bacterium]
MPTLPVVLYSTCPPYRGEAEAYSRQVRDVARWSEAGGCEGILVYTDNGLLDPWLVAQLVIQSTATLSPLVAVQPIYMHPYSVAKMVGTLSLLYGRRIDLNIVAGGFKNDLIALGDGTPHGRRYARLIEYTTILRALFRGGPVTFTGEFYAVSNLRLSPELAPELMPRILLSGSSSEGLAAARTLDALPVRYPEPPSESRAGTAEEADRFGIRVGIIARSEEQEAWAIARARFPEDRRGQVIHQLAMKVSDSAWHRQLSALAPQLTPESAYWMVPFQSYKTFCPYL